MNRTPRKKRAAFTVPLARRWLFPLAAALLLTTAPTAPAGPMDEEQLYTLPDAPERVHQRIEPLMRRALDRPKEETRVRALTEVARLELSGLRGRVVELIKQEDRPRVITGALQALDRLTRGDGDEEPSGGEASDGTAEAVLGFARPAERYSPQRIDQARIADRLLARWDHHPAAGVWVDRLEAGEAPDALCASAAEALGRVSHPSEPKRVREALAEAVADAQRALTVRRSAARSLARLTDTAAGPVELARQMHQRGGRLSDVLAADLMRYAKADPAVALLEELAGRDQPAVRYAAMRRLHQIEPALLHESAAETLNVADPKLRRLAAEAMATRTEPDSVGPLAETLNDPHPEVRQRARRSLKALAAESALAPKVRNALRDTLRRTLAQMPEQPMALWRAAEQAALLTGTLDDEASAERLLKLIDHPRLEVKLAAVAGVRRLEVEATRRPMLSRMKRLVKQITSRTEDDRVSMPDVASKVGAEVAQTLGVWDVGEADPVLRKLIPKSTIATPRCRASAIWALGLLHEGEPQKKLAKRLIQRATDRHPLNPEAMAVRLASTIALGRMGSEPQLSRLRSLYSSGTLQIRAAARWSIGRITGQMPPEVERSPLIHSETFISPLEKD